MDVELIAGRGTYWGLFFVALSTLMYEVLLTRIFSVTMWYHFAFVAISIAMFGMSLGAVLVYLFPRAFSLKRNTNRLGIYSVVFGVSIVVSFVVHLNIHLVPNMSSDGMHSLASTFAIIAVPFVFSGICVCICLTQFQSQVSRLYAADLCGAALGCLLVLVTLELVDAPSAVLVVGALALVGAWCFAVDGSVRHTSQAQSVRACAIVGTTLLMGLACVNAHLAETGRQPIKLIWVKGNKEIPGRFERWNSYSRVKVDAGDASGAALGWGLSENYHKHGEIHQLYLAIDASAGTTLTQTDGTPAGILKADFLKYDVTNTVYYLSNHAKVLIIGVGGGRDLLSALQFGAQSVTGVEINRSILQAVNGRFGDFTGHLDRDPRIHFFNDEARSFVARSTDRFDVIELSLVDTWAATAAGAFVLSENALYTVQAWDAFLSHLTPDGTLSVSRWYHTARPAETYRLAALACKGLRNAGITNPRQHLIVVLHLPGMKMLSQLKNGATMSPNDPDGVATLLASRRAFSDEDINRIEQVAQQMGFEIILSPRAAADSGLAAIVNSPDLDATAAAYPEDISPPTDDKPFFFNMNRFRDAFSAGYWSGGSGASPVAVVLKLLIFVIILTTCTILLPLLARLGVRNFAGSALPLTFFFCCIGVGFMLIEISQMQRLIVLLGHPTYSLSVVLFALLVSSGLGSATTRDASKEHTMARLILLVIVLSIVSFCTPYLTPMFQARSTPVRILAALAVLLPAGFFMGMAFPMGMKRAATENAALTPWLWGVNGATSVCASVLAVVVAMAWGISAASWIGVGFYLLAALAFARPSPTRLPASNPSTSDGACNASSWQSIS